LDTNKNERHYQLISDGILRMLKCV